MAKKTLVLGVIIIMALGLFGCRTNNGTVVDERPFYSLQAAYNKNFLSKKDLKSIASFHINGNDSVLSVETSNAIKASFVERYPQDGMTTNDARISKYYGTYGTCVAVMVGYSNSQYQELLWNETIAGEKFEYNNSQRILIWNSN